MPQPFASDGAGEGGGGGEGKMCGQHIGCVIYKMCVCVCVFTALASMTDSLFFSMTTRYV